MMEASYKVWSDLKKNRLYIVLKGLITDVMAKEAADMVITEAYKLSPGFSVINDCSELEPGNPAGAREIQRAQVGLGYCGVRRVIRVLHPANEIINKQFENTAKEYPFANTASSVEEAEKILDVAS
jgi:hypothetical protein